jgi:hypothetical protein
MQRATAKLFRKDPNFDVCLKFRQFFWGMFLLGFTQKAATDCEINCHQQQCAGTQKSFVDNFFIEENGTSKEESDASKAFGDGSPKNKNEGVNWFSHNHVPDVGCEE